MKYLAVILALIIGIPSIGDAGELTKTSFHYDIQWGHLIIGHISVSLEKRSRIECKWEPESDQFSDIRIFFSAVAKGLHLPVRMKLNRWFGTITFRLLIN